MTPLVLFNAAICCRWSPSPCPDAILFDLATGLDRASVKPTR
ncbi:MAG TPA: hypothetical protein VFK42_08335 [Acidimicrobiales bacterium]|nr:hypothetical protein [Acidimicrobiales bacterium]